MEALDMEPRSAALALTCALRRNIVTGALKGGERLTQDGVASRYKVSQTIVREAFKQLASEKLLVSEPRRGFRVPELSVAETEEITSLRCLIEPQALKWALPHMTAETVARAAALLDQIDEARDSDTLIRLNNDFHYTLYAPSGRERTLELITMLRVNFERYLRFTWETTDHIGTSQSEHREILSLCASKDSAKACERLEDHIRGTGTLLTASLHRRL